mgnify:CR=1 FL=1
MSGSGGKRRAGHRHDDRLRVLIGPWALRFSAARALRYSGAIHNRRLAAELSAGDEGRLVVEELRDGVRFKAGSWVGVVRFEAAESRSCRSWPAATPGSWA